MENGTINGPQAIPIDHTGGNWQMSAIGTYTPLTFRRWCGQIFAYGAVGRTSGSDTYIGSLPSGFCPYTPITVPLAAYGGVSRVIPSLRSGCHGSGVTYSHLTPDIACAAGVDTANEVSADRRSDRHRKRSDRWR